MSNYLTSVKQNKRKKRNYLIEYEKTVFETISQTSDIVKVAPLSYSQQQMWVIEQMQPGNYAYNLPLAFRIKGKLNVELLEICLNKIIRRHEIMRTTFSVLDNQPKQLIHREFQLKIKSINPGDFNGDNSEDAINILLSTEVIQPFDISTLPLIKVTLIELSDEEHILLLNMHHIISDGWSMKILLYELSGFYNSALDNVKFSLPELPIQYSDYVNLKRRKDWSPSYHEQLDYWSNQLQGNLPNLDLPYDKQRSAVQSPKGSGLLFFLSKDLTDKLNSIGIKRGCTFFMTVLAAFQVFLNKYSGMDDIIIGSPVSNRSALGENLIGNFLNMVALRSDISKYPDFLTLLQNSRKITLEALKHWDLPFEKIVEVLKIKRDLSRNPVFQVMLQFLPGFSFSLNRLEISNFFFDTGYSQLDLALHLYQSNDGYNCRLEYDTDLFAEETIRRMITNFQYLLNSLADNPEQKISDISIVNPGESNKLICEWNNTYEWFPEDLTLAELFEMQVEKTPDSIAVIYGESKLTYMELNQKANQIANYLRDIGVVPETIVGLCMERSLEMVAGILGILKAGGAYLPIDPEQPVERIRFIINDAGVKHVLTAKLYRDMFPENQLILMDSDWGSDSYNTDNISTAVTSRNLAYVIYTSGSTGQPKGVMVEHLSVVNFLFSMKQKPGISEKDILLAVTTISFDIAGLELFLPLISGAKVYLTNKVQAGDGYLLKKLIEKMNVTIMQATPATWKLMIDAGWEKTPGLKMLCGGESFSREFADELLTKGASLWNMYGPTETTIWSSVNKIENDKLPVLIGPPISNTRFYVVDKFNRIVPIGVPGELLIGGSGIARGYLNRDTLTAEKFIPDMFSRDGKNLYRTGDLVKYNSEGKIQFLGRLDYQVKIRGFRIETGEIENVLNFHESIKQSLVTPVDNNKGEKTLTAYLVTASQNNFSVKEIRNYLKKKLPDYMIPSFFIKLDKFPLTPNGKIDRKKLPLPEHKILSSVNHSVPRDELDIQLKLIWEKAFGVNNININDDFFEIGGHSLLAAQIFAQIRKILNKNLPLATLFRASTISRLADVIRENNWKPSWSSLVPIKLKGNKLPVFLIHGAEGNILLYKMLANYLSDDRPVYGLQSQGLDGKSPILENVREMAQKYIMEIKSVQPEGPYYLGGYCLGGTIAYEMSQQLTSAGEEVSLIALIETCNIQNNRTKLSFLLKTLHKIENIFFQLMNLYITRKKNRINYFSEKLKVEIERFKVKIDILYSKIFSILKSD
ncbi:MAG TPA: amino acid adenylation domain-containing protein, partial [Ignavibacteriaceae bacterium]|nr:amino acid adenylation domain-containing protein [Ignavibacteriaceae bacterium]